MSPDSGVVLLGFTKCSRFVVAYSSVVDLATGFDSGYAFTFEFQLWRLDQHRRSLTRVRFVCGCDYKVFVLFLFFEQNQIAQVFLIPLFESTAEPIIVESVGALQITILQSVDGGTFFVHGRCGVRADESVNDF